MWGWSVRNTMYAGAVWWLLSMGIVPYCAVILYFVMRTLEERDAKRAESGVPPVTFPEPYMPTST